MKHINRVIALALAVMMLSVPAMAARSPEQNGNPSIEQNGNPSVEQNGNPSVEQNGNPSVEQNGKPSAEQKGDPSAEQKGNENGTNEIIVSTLMDKDTDEKVLANLDAAEKQLADTKDLTTIAPKLADVLKEMKVETAADKLVVRDLFNLSVTGETEAQFKADKKLTVTFDLDLDDGQKLIVMVQNGEEWDVIPAADVVVEDGKATVTFTQLGIVAFVVA